MNHTNMTKLALLSLVFVLFASIGYAATCSGTFSGPTSFVYTGVPFNLNYFNAEAGSAGGDLTLVLPSGVTTSSVNPKTGIAAFTPYSWTVTSVADGNYTFVAMVNSTTVNCDRNFTVTIVDNVSDPHLTVGVQDVTTVVFGNSVTYQVTLTNDGAGAAKNVTGLTFATSGSTVTPGAFTVTAIGNTTGNNTNIATYTATPAACGSDLFNVQVQNYQDLIGENMGPVSGQDAFSVIGTDLAFQSFGASASSVVQGQTVTFTANVRNIGTMDAASATVGVYRDSEHLGDVALTNVLIGASVGGVYSYAVPGNMTPGTYTISAHITAPNECSGINNDASFTMDVAAGYCGDGIVNGAEQCDGGASCDSSCNTIAYTGGGGGGGGGSSHAVDIALSEAMPSASLTVNRYDTVRISYDGKVYVFRFRAIFSDYVRIELVTPSTMRNVNEGDFTTFDLDRDGDEDIKVTVLDVTGSQAALKFELLGVAGLTNESTRVGILDFPAPVKKDRTVVSAPVETAPPAPEPVKETLLRGFITFMENFTMKNAVPVWAGALLAVLIAVFGAGLYLVLTRKR